MADVSRLEPLVRLGRTRLSTDALQPSRGRDRISVAIDVATVIGCTLIACTFVLHRSGTGVLRAIALHPDHLWIAALLVLGYAFSVVFNCERLNLYMPERHTTILHEQRDVLQASLTSGLLLVATLYLLHPKDSRTEIVVSTAILTSVVLSTRRLAARVFLQRSLAQGAGVRNAFIVGTGLTAQALRGHIENMRHLGYVFKGFISAPSANTREYPCPGVIGTLDSLFDHVRRHYVDEVFFTTPCDREDVQRVLEEARYHGVTIRLVPDLYDSSILNPPLEYLGQFPTIPLCRRTMPESRLFLKRTLDIVISALTLIVVSPLFLLIAVAIKRESEGRVFYISERIGKKGRVFRCIKFRTMVVDADSLRAALHSRNQRDGILFKIDNDPRVTPVGRFLRKYSLDELPQFINVLKGEMSIVGPRPPIAGEVMKYKPGQLRRLEVTPGITGLWQVQARKDPSFDKYVSLDMTYIENWSIRLDFEIMLRTIGVVIAGTGS
jgi:exopolysaccharide biosynthesis polyprenyl glycosylphosphotransferase